MTNKSPRRKRRKKVPKSVQRKVRNIHYDEGKKAVVCAWCGVAEDESIGKIPEHHIDGDRNNSSVENLIPLCDHNYKNNCHLRKGHNGNTKKINNNLLKEINMKDLDHTIRAFHFAARNGLLGKDPTRRINLPLNGAVRHLTNSDGTQTSSWSHINGESKEYTDDSEFKKMFTDPRELDEFYKEILNPLVDLEKKYPFHNKDGLIENVYGTKDNSDSRLWKKRYDFATTKPEGNRGSANRNSERNTGVVINFMNLETTGSFLDAVTQDPERALSCARVIYELSKLEVA